MRTGSICREQEEQRVWKIAELPCGRQVFPAPMRSREREFKFKRRSHAIQRAERSARSLSTTGVALSPSRSVSELGFIRLAILLYSVYKNERRITDAGKCNNHDTEQKKVFPRNFSRCHQ